MAARRLLPRLRGSPPSPRRGLDAHPLFPLLRSCGEQDHTYTEEHMVNEPLIQPIEDLVRRKAYELYVDRLEQEQPGSEFDDWITAEHEIVSAASCPNGS